MRLLLDDENADVDQLIEKTLGELDDNMRYPKQDANVSVFRSGSLQRPPAKSAVLKWSACRLPGRLLIRNGSNLLICHILMGKVAGCGILAR